MIEVRDPAAALFASDMHLDDEQPALTARFLADLDARLSALVASSPRPAPPRASADAPALFLLGDLFEFWIGDDAPEAAADQLGQRLARASAEGVRVFLMHGNRDFLIDAPLPGAVGAPTWSHRVGATLLPDPTVVTIAGRPVLLSHGDALCTGDARYQHWRTLCRSPRWQADALARPIAERRAMAQALRRQSQSSQQQAMSLDTLGDVDPGAVDAVMTKHDVAILVHGHTHRPALHRWQHASQTRYRWVLQDWTLNADPGESEPRGAVRSFAEGLPDLSR